MALFYYCRQAFRVFMIDQLCDGNLEDVSDIYLSYTIYFFFYTLTCCILCGLKWDYLKSTVGHLRLYL